MTANENDMGIELEGELLDYFHQFMEWIKKNQRISDSHLNRLKSRAIRELHNDSQKWYCDKEFSDLYSFCFFKTVYGE
jgi:hypothetical protein